MVSHSFLLFFFPRPIQAGPVLAQQTFCFSAKGILEHDSHNQCAKHCSYRLQPGIYGPKLFSPANKRNTNKQHKQQNPLAPERGDPGTDAAQRAKSEQLLPAAVGFLDGAGFLPGSFCTVFSGIVFLLSASDFGYKKRTFLLCRGNVLIFWTG